MSSLIHERMAAIMKATNAIAKKQYNQGLHFNFRGIDDVMNSLHAIFAENEVFILPEVLGKPDIENRACKSGIQAFTRMLVKYHYVTTDGSEVCTTNVGEAQDTSDKGANKAMSIALKYSLLQMLLIPTDETKDPDAMAPEARDLEQSLALALQEVGAAQTMQSLLDVWNNYDFLRQNKAFISAVTARKTALQNG